MAGRAAEPETPTKPDIAYALDGWWSIGIALAHPPLVLRSAFCRAGTAGLNVYPYISPFLQSY